MARLIDKELVQRRFARTLQSYGEHAVVQRVMVQRLVTMVCDAWSAFAVPCSGAVGVDDGGPCFGRVLEVGAGTGALTVELLRRARVEYYVANDLVPACGAVLDELVNELAGEGLGVVGSVVEPAVRAGSFSFLAGDIERVVALPENLDLVVSNATVQWLSDLEGFVARVAKSLRSGGIFAFSSFGPENMREIVALTGVGLRYRPLSGLVALGGEWFEVLVQEESVQVEWFASPGAVLEHLRRTGVNGVAGERWSKGRYRAFVDEYGERFGVDGGVGLTYHPVFCCMRRIGR